MESNLYVNRSIRAGLVCAQSEGSSDVSVCRSYFVSLMGRLRRTWCLMVKIWAIGVFN